MEKEGVEKNAGWGVAEARRMDGWMDGWEIEKKKGHHSK